jgi:hypothetical protein
MTRRLILWAVACALTVPLAASAFCGFYVAGANDKLFNNATVVVLMREGTRTVLSMQNNYQGPPEDFAMVVPVPVVLQKENVRTLAPEIFSRVDQLAAPRLVEYWEQDPCPSADFDLFERGFGSGGGGLSLGSLSTKGRGMGVRVEAQFNVGEYDVVVLSASDSSSLDTWLRQEHYQIPEGAEPLLRPYVRAGMKFFVAKVDTSKVHFRNGQAMLSPLRFHYDSESFSLPVRLGLMNSNGTQDLLVHILARNQRYEMANYPNATIPTNIDVVDETKGAFAPFYAALFDKTLEKHPHAVVTEYAWQAMTCDPCPGPALDAPTLATLGADALPTLGSPSSLRGSVGAFVLTRLHARYAKESLGEDLVFQAAPPIVGGRERMQENGRLETGARADALNNFQARYAVRHPWKGPIACKSPRRGMWGGPPGGGEVPTAQAAKDLAFAPRGKIRLSELVKQDVPELDVRSARRP